MNKSMAGGFFRFLGGAGRGCCPTVELAFGFLAEVGPTEGLASCCSPNGPCCPDAGAGVVAEGPLMLSCGLLIDVRSTSVMGLASDTDGTAGGVFVC